MRSLRNQGIPAMHADDVSRIAVNELDCPFPRIDVEKGLINLDSEFLHRFWDELYKDPMYGDANIPKECIQDIIKNIIVGFTLDTEMLDDDMKKKFIEVFAKVGIEYLDGCEIPKEPEIELPVEDSFVSDTDSNLFIVRLETGLTTLNSMTIKNSIDTLIPAGASIISVHAENSEDVNGSVKLIINYAIRQ
jgi:hypothetical protein